MTTPTRRIAIEELCGHRRLSGHQVPEDDGSWYGYCTGGFRLVISKETAEQIIAEQIARLHYTVGDAVEHAGRILDALAEGVA